MHGINKLTLVLVCAKYQNNWKNNTKKLKYDIKSKSKEKLSIVHAFPLINNG